MHSNVIIIRKFGIIIVKSEVQQKLKLSQYVIRMIAISSNLFR